MPRASASATITLGLVAIPVKIYTSASDESVQFNLLSPEGNRVRQVLVDSVSGAEVPRNETVKGYEVVKDQFVKFTQEELTDLQLPSAKTVDIKEFASIDAIDFAHVEKTYYLGPDKGGDKGYKMIALAMSHKKVVAVVQWSTHGREHLAIIRPYKHGLIMQLMFYKNEIRDFDDIAVADVGISVGELGMAYQLIDSLHPESLDLAKYEDRYTKAVREAVEVKIAGRQVQVVMGVPRVTAVDMVASLQSSLDAVKSKNPAPEGKPKRTRKKDS